MLWAQEQQPVMPPETPPALVMPDLRGLTVLEAQGQCPKLATVVPLSSAGPEGRVLYQIPGAGASLGSGEELTLYVSVAAPPSAPIPSASAEAPSAWAQSLRNLAWLVLAQLALLQIWAVILVRLSRVQQSRQGEFLESLRFEREPENSSGRTGC